MKRMKIAAVAVCSVLALFSCDQGLNVDGKNEVASADRRPRYAEYNDGDYTFCFKNGKSISGDCDGYNLDPKGKTTIYEYFQSDINKWEKRIKDVGITPEVYRVGGVQYCWVRFDTSLLRGVATTGNDAYSETAVFKNGKKVKFDSKKIDYMSVDIHWSHSSPDNPYLRIDLQDSIWVGGSSPIPGVVNKLKSIGVTIVETHEQTQLKRSCVVVDPTGILFAQSYE